MTSIARTVVVGLATAAAATTLGLAGADTASAQQFGGAYLAPSQGICTPSQYASYAVRANGTATDGGAKFKLLRNGVVITNTPGRVTAWGSQLFVGPGFYSVCAQNTGPAATYATVQLRTDAEA